MRLARLSCAGAVALILLSTGGCRRESRRDRAGTTTLTILYPGDEHAFSLLWDEDAKFLVFLPLVTRNAQGELEGRLARSWEHSPDYRTWTVHLRSDIRWHDGMPVTANDIKFTLEFLSRPEVLQLSPGAVSVTVLDDTTYTLTLHRGTDGSPLDDDWTVYYPKHLLERLDPAKWREWEFWVHPVGDGPYRYVRHVPRTMIELEANPDYYRGRPRIERVVLRFGDPQVTELLSGNVDAIPEFNEIDLLKLAGDPRFEAYQGFRLFFARALVWNTRRPALRDVKVRRALTLAIDRRELDRALSLPAATPVFDVIFSEGQLRRGEVPPALPHDTAEARRLLAEAGWGEVGEGGVGRRGGEPLRFAVLVSPLQGMDRAAVLIQAQLRAVGVQVDVQTLQLDALVGKVKAGEFDAVLVTMPIDGRLWSWGAFFGPSSPSGYNNPRVVALLERARAAMDPDEVDRAYRELAPIFQAELPVTFLAPAVRTTVANRRLRGLSSPYRASPVWHMDELWLERSVP
jgi:peptide/nickel transport system substrate-binding protein